MKPKILIFIDWFLPGYQAGGPVRSIANLIDHLGDAAEFNILTRNTDYTETKPYEGIEANTWLSFSKNTQVYYFSKDQLKAKYIKHVAESANCDVWYITGVYSRLFSILPARTKTNSRKIIAPRGMLSAHAIDVKSGKKRTFLKMVSISNMYRDSTFHATNTSEAQDIAKLFPKNNIEVVANLPLKQSAGQTAKISKKANELRLCSVTRIAPEKNTLGAIEILKALSDSIDKNTIVTYDLYGHLYDNEYWEKCRVLISSLPNNIKLTYHGSIEPGQIPEKILDSHFLFLPTQGENFGHAIMEALSLGRPVIISDQTPWKALEDQKAGWDLPLAHSEKFIEVLIKCIEMEQKTYTEFSKAAKNFFKNNSKLEETIEEYTTLFSNEAKRIQTS